MWMELQKHLKLCFSCVQARQPNGADLFICYAGVQMREAVASKADWLIFDFDELMGYLV